MKTINIDEYLKEQGITVTIKGKEFMVTDIPVEIKAELGKDADERNEKEIVKQILGCEDEDLKGYGLAAFSAIIKQVTDSLFPAPSTNDQ